MLHQQVVCSVSANALCFLLCRNSRKHHNCRGVPSESRRSSGWGPVLAVHCSWRTEAKLTIAGSLELDDVQIRLLLVQQ